MIRIERSDWTKMDWQSAQEAVVKLMQGNGFMVFNEKKVYNGRVDGVVIRKTTEQIIIGIIEVKHYKRITKSVREKAMIQSLKYLRSIYDDISRKYPMRPQHYFLASVFTYDYPTSGNSLFVSKLLARIPDFIKENAVVSVFSCTPEHLIPKLKEMGLVEGRQNTLNDFFD